MEEEEILASFSPLHSSFSAISVELGEARVCPGRVRDRKFMLTDALTTYFFLTRLNVGFIVI